MCDAMGKKMSDRLGQVPGLRGAQVTRQFPAHNRFVVALEGGEPFIAKAAPIGELLHVRMDMLEWTVGCIHQYHGKLIHLGIPVPPDLFCSPAATATSMRCWW